MHDMEQYVNWIKQFDLLYNHFSDQCRFTQICSFFSSALTSSRKVKTVEKNSGLSFKKRVGLKPKKRLLFREKS